MRSCPYASGPSTPATPPPWSTILSVPWPVACCRKTSACVTSCTPDRTKKSSPFCRAIVFQAIASQWTSEGVLSLICPDGLSEGGPWRLRDSSKKWPPGGLIPHLPPLLSLPTLTLLLQARQGLPQDQQYQHRRFDCRQRGADQGGSAGSLTKKIRRLILSSLRTAPTDPMPLRTSPIGISTRGSGTTRPRKDLVGAPIQGWTSQFWRAWRIAIWSPLIPFATPASSSPALRTICLPRDLSILSMSMASRFVKGEINSTVAFDRLASGSRMLVQVGILPDPVATIMTREV
mmetsp:Transcript_5149/g.14588  ORF Transcript_5149/g.14588 Transcript_5149/m.14588 type:complete len:290 (-) Transcript_5149:385-1254(-)